MPYGVKYTEAFIFGQESYKLSSNRCLWNEYNTCLGTKCCEFRVNVNTTSGHTLHNTSKTMLKIAELGTAGHPKSVAVPQSLVLFFFLFCINLYCISICIVFVSFTLMMCIIFFDRSSITSLKRTANNNLQWTITQMNASFTLMMCISFVLFEVV